MLLAICGRTPVASLPKRSPSFDCCREGIRTASYLQTFTRITADY